MITIFTMYHCFKCETAKRKLKEKGIEFKEENAWDNMEYLEKLNQLSMPVITRDGELVEIKDLLG
jgi:glutaredoxin